MKYGMRIQRPNSIAFMSVLFFSVTLLFIGGCSFPGGNDRPDEITGTWTGTVTDGTNTWVTTLRLAQSGANVSGTCTVTKASETLSCTISGTYRDGEGTLRIYSGGSLISTLTLEFEDDHATGTATSDAGGLSGTANLTLQN